ncbi:MAG: hypothetical protein IPG45_34445 [Deltaproteobacteria bacterium]|nr:hypothetical protein [Deltaproteobacteria bacterium]
MPWVQTTAAVTTFTLVVYLVHFGFAAHFGDPLGYLIAILKPLALTLPAFLLLRVVLHGEDWTVELTRLSESARLAALSSAGFAPVIWFYLLTSPTPTFPIIASLFGALAFWLPFGLDVIRRSPKSTRLWALGWVALMWTGSAGAVLIHLAGELERSALAVVIGGAG